MPCATIVSGAVLLDQRQPGSVGARDRLDRIGGHSGEQRLQTHPVRPQPRQVGQAVAQILILIDPMLLGGRVNRCESICPGLLEVGA